MVLEDILSMVTVFFFQQTTDSVVYIILQILYIAGMYGILPAGG